MNLIILGAPGSGKGTSATVLREKFDLAHISTGDLFRYNIKENTPLGIEAKSYIDKGALVPDDVTIRMVEDRLSNPDCEKGYILDGFPRNIAQAEALDKMLEAKGSKIDAVVYVKCDDEIIMDRVTTRRVCEKCGRQRASATFAAAMSSRDLTIIRRQYPRDSRHTESIHSPLSISTTREESS